MIALAEMLLAPILTAFVATVGHGLHIGHRRRVVRRGVNEYLDWLFTELEVS
jgi:hypothetical protein